MIVPLVRVTLLVICSTSIISGPIESLDLSVQPKLVLVGTSRLVNFRAESHGGSFISLSGRAMH